MSDLIDRETAVKRIMKESKYYDEYPTIPCIKHGLEIAAMIVLKKIPSAPERKTGRWIVVDEQEPRRYGCSKCKRLVWHIENYCPNCGALMEVRDE